MATTSGAVVVSTVRLFLPNAISDSGLPVPREYSRGLKVCVGGLQRALTTKIDKIMRGFPWHVIEEVSLEYGLY